MRKKLDTPILFNATLAQKTRWTVAAHRADTSLSAWLRDAAEARFSIEMPEGAESAFPIDDHTPEAEAIRDELLQG